MGSLASGLAVSVEIAIFNIEIESAKGEVGNHWPWPTYFKHRVEHVLQQHSLVTHSHSHSQIVSAHTWCPQICSGHQTMHVGVARLPTPHINGSYLAAHNKTACTILTSRGHGLLH